MKRMAPKTAKPTARKQALVIVVSTLILVIFIGLYSWYSATVGQAISIDGTAWRGGPIDLTEHGSVTFARLPALGVEQGFTYELIVPTARIEEQPRAYRLDIVKLDALSYQVSLSLTTGENVLTIAVDTFSTLLAEDTSFFHLPHPEDASRYDEIPDLKVTLKDGRLTFTNLHYIGFASAQISLVRADTFASYPGVIALQPGERFTAVVNASSEFLAPGIEAVYAGQPVTLQDVRQNPLHPQQNFTTGTLTITAPGEASAVTLDLAAVVQNQKTHRYYTFAVGNVVYALPGAAKAPEYLLRLSETDRTRATLTITLAPTTELQPLVLPCEVTGSLNTLFANTRVQKAYTYDAVSRQPLVWTKGAPSDFTSFEALSAFRGYFVQAAGTEPATGGAGERTISIPCTVKSLQSLGPVPALGAAYTRLPAGWNLVALPGVTPRSITDFTLDRDFALYSCENGYPCTGISATSMLLPGRTYWLYSASPLTLYYKLE